MSSEVQHIDLLTEMLSIPATSRKEDLRSEFLEAYLKGLDFEVTRIHNNLLVGTTGTEGAGPAVLLNSHMDTVPPAEGWVNDPFIPLKENGRITGLGSNDAGASVVTMIATYKKMHPILNGQINLLLLISAEEEVSGPRGISSVMDQLGEVDAVIVGEPTGMKPAVAERGLMVIDGQVKGKAGHAARNEGENAIYKTMKDLQRIQQLEFRNKSEWLPDPGAQVTMISSGTGHNVVPDLCKFVVDVRSNDKYGNEEILEMIRSVCEAELVARSTRLKPSSLKSGHFLMEAIQLTGLQPFGSSTMSDMALIPFPSVKLGPGNSARSHTAGEFILLSEMEEAVEVYSKFLFSIRDIINEP